jgi:hypothetical protein
VKTRLGLLAGIALSAAGVLGIAGSGIVSNFLGRFYGLGGTVASLVLVAISLVLLRPLPPEPVLVIEPQTQPTLSEPIRLKRPEASLIGSLLATFGTLGLAASGLLWNFQGLALGLTGTITSLAALAFSVLFLWPSAGRTAARPMSPSPIRDPEPAAVAMVEERDVTPTTAEEIARSLAEEQESASPPDLVTFAPDHLLPGQTLVRRKRRPGASLKGYRGMVEELFRT